MAKKPSTAAVSILSMLLLLIIHSASAQTIVLIRHGEKPKKGDNLNCRGINRSLALVDVLHTRFGIPEAIYVPSLSRKDNTKHARMFQTILPFASKYNLPVNSGFRVADTAELAEAARKKTGVVIIVWEHNQLPSIARCLGVTEKSLEWSDDDFDSMWVVTYKHNKVLLERTAEDIHPSEKCPE
jgi:hypothetical protein